MSNRIPRSVLLSSATAAVVTVAMRALPSVSTPESLLVEHDEIGSFIGSEDATEELDANGLRLNSQGRVLDTLESCVALLDGAGEIQVTDGRPEIYDVVLRLLTEDMIFSVDSTEPREPGVDCSGTFQQGIYRDIVFLDEVNDEFNGETVSITMDILDRGSVLGPIEFQMRTGAEDFFLISNSFDLSPGLGDSLGDFAANASHVFPVADNPGTVALTAPLCRPVEYNGNSALTSDLIIERNGVPITALIPGSSYQATLSTLAPNTPHHFRAYCSIADALEKLGLETGLDTGFIPQRSIYAPGVVSFFLQAPLELDEPPPPPAIQIDTAPLSTGEDMALPITFSATSPNGSDLGFTVTGAPAHGTLSALTADGGTPVTTATASYTPDDDYYGPDSITLRVDDGDIQSTATIPITVTAVNDAPSLGVDAADTNEDEALVITVTASEDTPGEAGDEIAAVLTRGLYDFDESGAEITDNLGTLYQYSEAVLAGDIAGGSELNPGDTVSDAQGRLIYVPFRDRNGDGADPDFLQFTPRFELQAQETLASTGANGLQNSAPAVVPIMVNAVNDAPVAYGYNFVTAPAFHTEYALDAGAWPEPAAGECFEFCVFFEEFEEPAWDGDGFPDIDVFLGGQDIEISDLRFVINDVYFPDGAVLTLANDPVETLPDGAGVDYEVPGTYSSAQAVHRLLTLRHDPGQEATAGAPATAALDYHARITYTVYDEQGLASAPKTVDIGIENAGDFPQGEDDNYPVAGDDTHFNVSLLEVWEDTPHYFHVIGTDPEGDDFEFIVLDCNDTDGRYFLPNSDQYQYVSDDPEPFLDVYRSLRLGSNVSGEQINCGPWDDEDHGSDDDREPEYSFEGSQEKGWFLTYIPDADLEPDAPLYLHTSLSLYFKDDTIVFGDREDPVGRRYHVVLNPVNDAPRFLADGTLVPLDKFTVPGTDNTRPIAPTWTATYNNGFVALDLQATIDRDVSAGSPFALTEFSLEDPDLNGDLVLTVTVSGGAVTFDLPAGANVSAQTSGSVTLEGTTAQLSTWLGGLSLTPAAAGSLVISVEGLDTQSTGGCPFGIQEEENPDGTCDRVSTLIVNLEVND
ncbi:MAG: Ig-like domain-containing protein [Pseudohongiellaceae bacterium]